MSKTVISSEEELVGSGSPEIVKQRKRECESPTFLWLTKLSDKTLKNIFLVKDFSD